MDDTGRGWVALLRAQAGVFTVEQAAENGFDYYRLRWKVRSGRWRRVHPRVYSAHSGPLSWAARLWAAVLFAGSGAVLCRQTAAHAWGLVEAPTPIVHVLVVGAGHPRATPGVAVHRTRELRRGDVFRSRAPTRTSFDRTVLDLVELATRPDDVQALVAKAMQRGRTTPARLGRALERRPRLRHRRLVREALVLAEQGAESLLEIRHEELGRAHGLPVPRRQAHHDRGNRSARLDAFYESYGVAVELDGRLSHTEARQWWDDMDRDNSLQTQGLLVLRFPGFIVLNDPCRVAATIAKALHSRGWTTPYHPCPTCQTTPDRSKEMCGG
ncbi:DUF559 domain-containing protein [Parafrankia sp. BMG5.11]|nr:DUF559 domain-containing protein [Parafrankia sp. BMG5.11]SQD97214.1 conserved hypothetical protein [Parafrankia sp. Ea1.12]